MSDMEYDSGDYFREHADEEVRGFTILSAETGTYELGERWERPDDDPLWHKYSVSEEQLLDRVEDGACEKVGSLTDDQFERVKKAVGIARRDLKRRVEGEA